jgi:hypothetical protein
MNAINIDPIVNMVLNPSTHEDAAVAGFRVMHRNAAIIGGLENMLSRSNDLLRIIAKRDKEITLLKAQINDAQQALKMAEKSRKAYAAEQAIEKEREVEARISDAVRAMIRGSKPNTNSTVLSVNDNATARPKSVRKVAAKASSRPRRRVVTVKTRGADTDNLVLSLLTNELKCVSALFQQAQRLGFEGSEGTIRFAAERVTVAGNAEEGRDHQGRVAYRRTS